MYLSRFGPATAMVLSGAALCLLALAPLGWRLGWWHYGFGLYQLLPAAGLVGAVAVAVSILSLVLGWSHLLPRRLAILSGAVVLGSTIAYVPWQYSRTRNTLPPIHDITTDTDNPPTFSAVVLAARAAEHAGSVDDRRPELAQQQKAAYHDVVPVMTKLPKLTVFDEALQVAKSMPGWTIVASDAYAGRIDANQQSRWFRFTDDIVIRITANNNGCCRIDMRSTSRQGRSDYGVNAARIRAYMSALRQRIG